MRRLGLKFGLGGLCAAAFVSGTLSLRPGSTVESNCHAEAKQSPPSPIPAIDWLRHQGADVAAITIAESQTDGYGVYATDAIRLRAANSSVWARLTSWVRPISVIVASFPLSNALVPGNLARHQAILRQSMESGAADGREAVMLHLAVERQRLRERGPMGTSDELAWLALLPTSFGTTLFFSELDMQWLRGTNLFKATRMRQASLRSSWKKLEPTARQLAQASGLQAPPSLDDWRWANSIYWSRAIAFPSPGGGVQEGIVPGLDFCNHASESPCKWEVFSAAKAPGLQQDSISLVCPLRSLPAPGAELSIDYGPKGNEELLFLYGFVLPDNKNDVLTLMLPLPPSSEWDEQLLPRIQLLQQRGLQPQVHLPAADLARISAAVGAGGPPAGLALPQGVVETLEVFLLPHQQVQQQLDVGTNAAGGLDRDTTGKGLEQSLGVLTTLVRLLEVKLQDMESEDAGTGPLERDEQLLATAGALTSNQRNALTYRMSQKRLARGWLAQASMLLQQEMVRLRQQQTGIGVARIDV